MKPLLYSMITLASGVIIGAAATAIILHAKPNRSAHPKGLEWITERMVNMMTHELSLTPEQEEQIRPIIKGHFQNIDKIRKEARPKIQKEIEAMNDDLLAVFSDQQKTLWQERIQQMKDRFPGMRQRRGGPGQHGPGRGPGGQGRLGDQNDNRQGMEGGDFRHGGRRHPWPPMEPNQPPLPKNKAPEQQPPNDML